MSTRTILCTITALVTLAATSSRDARAAMIFVDTSTGGGQVGAFYGPYTASDDPPAAYPPILDPDNSPLFQNYFMGRSTISGFTTSERRVFFFFDMAGVAASIPVGESVTDVTLALELLPAAQVPWRTSPATKKWSRSVRRSSPRGRSSIR